MTLVVVSHLDLEELEVSVRQNFANIPSISNYTPPTFADACSPYDSSMLGSQLVVGAVRERHRLSLVFPLPPKLDEYLLKAHEYVESLIGHEGVPRMLGAWLMSNWSGPGSLLSALKKEQLADGLSAGIGDDGIEANSNCFLFSIEVQLSEAGVQAMDRVALMVITAHLLRAVLRAVLWVGLELHPIHWYSRA